MSMKNSRKSVGTFCLTDTKADKGESNMKKQNILSKIYCLALTACFLITQASACLQVRAESPVNVIACSDFQNPGGNDAGKAFVQNVLSQMQDAGTTSADGFVCCGDYNYSFGGTEDGVNALRDAVSSMVSGNMNFIQGNHDAGIATEGISESGNNDPESGEYGVFVINEDDYMWFNDNEATIKRTAQNLIDYMNEKISAGYDKPIFVASHLPLHYSMRTKNDGDGMYANYIFDVLNEAGAKGLNIIFLFGHDHSNGWDDYLGGSCAYLEKGDDILIAQGSRTDFKTKNLNFTYMNAGYTGYYQNVNGADDTLTMTLFGISDDAVNIARYSEEGLYNLKSAGVTNSYRDETGYEPNTTVYESPQSVPLTAVTDFSPIEDLIKQPDVGNQDYYKSITSLNDLKDGGRYLLVYSSYIMLPEVVGTDRIGFNLELASGFGDDIALGDYTDKEWVFTKNGDGWMIGDGKKYAALTDTPDTKITATLEDTGDVFAIGGSAGHYTFTSGSYVLNYNSRGLINGYEANPAEFSIYEFVEREKPSTETVIHHTQAGIEAETTLYNVPAGTIMIMAGYKDGCLTETLGIRTVSLEASEHFTASEGMDMDTVKVFLLDGLDTLAPISERERIPL